MLRLDQAQARPEHERKEAMNRHAELQIFKLKFVIALAIAVTAKHLFF